MDKLIARRRAAHPEKPCECWDCLREVGLTPPLKMRSKFRCQFPKPWHLVRGPGVDVPGNINHSLLVQGDKPDPLEAVTPVEEKFAGRLM